MNKIAKNIGIAIGVLLLICLTFGQAFFYNFAPSDDLFLVVQNLAIRGVNLQNLQTVFTSYDPELYIPLTFVSYQIDYMIGGLQPHVYHATNIALHTANVLLVMWLVYLCVPRRILAIFAGLLFAVHPIQTEAVVWIASRKDLLSTLFYLLSFILYVRADGQKNRLYVGSLSCFFLALLAKVSVLTLPVALAVYNVYIAHRPLRSFYKNLVPYIALAIVFFAIALVGKQQAAGILSVADLLLLGCQSTMFYVGKLVLPVGFSILHPYTDSISMLVLWPYVLGVVCLLSIAYRARHNYSWITFCIALYIIGVAPTFINVAKASYIFFAVDRYMYLPLIAIVLCIAFLIDHFYKKLSLNLYIGGSVAVAIFAVLSFYQVQTWQSPTALYEHAVQVYPESAAARASLARIYREEKQYNKAFAVLQEGLQYSKHPSLYLGAGYIYARVGQVADAREQFTKAASIDPGNAEPVFSLGSLEEQVGNTKRAQQLYEKAILLDQSYVIARVRYAGLLLADGNTQKAAEQLQQALEWNPNSVDAHLLYADVFDVLGNTQIAAEHRAKAQKLQIGGQPFH